VSAALRIVPPGQTAAFLAALPLAAVALPVAVRTRLRYLGVRTLGELAALPGGAVAAQFGPEGLAAWETARGVDRRPFVVREREATIRETLTFPAPTADQDAILTGARLLVRRLLRHPEIGNRLVRGMSVRANGEPLPQLLPYEGRGDTPVTSLPMSLPSLVGKGAGGLGSPLWHWSTTFQEPAADPERLLSLLRHKLETVTLAGPVTELTITLTGFCGERGRQAGLFTVKARRQGSLAEALRQLQARYGHPAVLRFVPVEPWSRLPERRLALAAFEC
jgi:nucleotidyltransferase/DNA polymerase involved in DNA repair